MSYKRRFNHYLTQFHSLLNGGIALPRWTEGVGVRLVLMLALVGTSLGYVLQISRTAVSGYETHSLEKQIAALSRENKELSAKVAEYSSLSSIYERLPEVNMEKQGKVSYVSVGDINSVAKK